MKNSPALGIDLGGTKIYAVVTDSKHNIIGEAKAETDYAAGPEKIVSDIIALGVTVLEPLGLTLEDVPHIGVAIPSPVDPLTGDCYHATNLGWKNASLKDFFFHKLNREVYLGNDGNLGVLAEYYCGAAQGFSTVAGYCVGTGLGGGIMINGKLHAGNSGPAGEFGHVIVKQGGRRCACGHKGCAEAYCSKVAFVKAIKKSVFQQGVKTCLSPDKFNKNSRNIKSKHLAKAYRADDPAVVAAVNKGAYMLGVAAAGVASVLAPDCFILGGGVIESMGNEILPVFRNSFNEHLFGLDPAKIQIRFSALGDTAVALGATILARKKGEV